MRKLILICAAMTVVSLAMTSCSSLRTGSREENSHATVAPEIVSYNELTMDLDPTGVTYTIDISTPEGKLKLDKISLAEAQQLGPHTDGELIDPHAHPFAHEEMPQLVYQDDDAENQNRRQYFEYGEHYLQIR